MNQTNQGKSKIIKINNIEDIGVSILYNSENAFVGYIKTYLSLLDVRKQIKEKSLDGYNIRFWKDDDVATANYQIINIDSKGKLSIRPKGFFTLADDYLTKLI